MSTDFEKIIECLYKTGFDSDAENNDLRDLKSNLKFVHTDDKTFVIIIAISQRNRYRNQMVRINCRGGNPIGGYEYDNVNDCYEVSCVNYLTLGYIPVSYRLLSKSFRCWEMVVPLPEDLIIRYLDEIQIVNLKKFKDQFDDEFVFEFIQMVN